jgi:hypothetical protein
MADDLAKLLAELRAAEKAVDLEAMHKVFAELLDVAQAADETLRLESLAVELDDFGPVKEAEAAGRKASKARERLAVALSRLTAAKGGE